MTRILFSIFFLSIGTVALAAPFQPVDLEPGDTYQLIFVTTGARDATSPNIADYHAFVQAQAELSTLFTGTDEGVTYSAVASARNDSNAGARENAVVSHPVYNFSGLKVADDFADFWDGSLDFAVEYDQFGGFSSAPVWTGSTAAGFEASNSSLGSLSGAANIGGANLATSSWMFDDTLATNTSASFYALSTPITIPLETAPEDLNGDGFVDGLDLGILLGFWLQSTTPANGELNGTPPVDGLDLGIFLGAWQPQPSVSAAVVSEPSSLLMVFSLMITLSVSKRQ